MESLNWTNKFLNPLPNNKMLDWFKLKAFADDIINKIQKSKFVLGRVENIMGKEENASYQHFLILPQCFKSLPYNFEFQQRREGKLLKTL